MLKMNHNSKLIKLSRKEKEKGFYSFYDGYSYRKFTNRRQYIKAINKREKELSSVAEMILSATSIELLTMQSPKDQLDSLSIRLRRLQQVYYYSNRQIINDDNRICDILMNLENELKGNKKVRRETGLIL